MDRSKNVTFEIGARRNMYHIVEIRGTPYITTNGGIGN